MAKEESKAPVEGTVTNTFPNATFGVTLDDGRSVSAYLSGRMRINRIKVLIGDRVSLTLDQYGERGRIIKRL